MEPLDKKAKSVRACETCKKPFGLTRMRHTCKRCNKIICADCTKGRIKIVTYDLKAPHKVCLACEKEHHFQVNFKTSHQTSWNTLSKIGQKWLAACNPKQKLTHSQEGYEETYQGYLEIVKNPYFSTQNEFLNMIDRDIAQGRLDRERTNYSFQEFLYHNQAKVTQEQVRTSMANVLKAFIIKFPEIGYCQGMNYICMFLLCLMDEESAFWMLGYVVANLVPVGFYGQTDFGVPLVGFQQEKFVLSNLIKEYCSLDSDMAQKITTLLDVHGATLLAPLLANFTNFEVLFETWNKMLTTNSINEVRKVIIHMMKVFLPKMKQKNIINPVEFQVMVIRLFNTEEFRDAQSIEIDEAHVRFLEDKFKGDHSNWHSHETKIHHALRRVMKFNKAQIKSLRERFDKLLGTRPRRSTNKLNQSMIAGEDPEGVVREDFRKLLTEVLSNDPDSKRLMESIDVDQLYDTLDSDKTGMLDFKEFLFLVSMMLKGSFEEKIQSAFYVFDSGDKGVLTSNEFDQFLQILIQTTVQANQDNITPFFNQDLEKFNERMASITNDKDKIDFDTIKKELFSSNFIKYSEVIEQLGKQNENSSKRNTINKEANIDASILQTNQTYMDSTQDTTHLTHHMPIKADDLTRILDQTNEQSTVYEIEESKYEEDRPNDEILTEAQKEVILPVDKLVEEKEATVVEPVKQEEKLSKAGVIEEIRDSEDNTVRKSSKVEYTTTASAKSLIEKFNKNKRVETAMPPKKPEPIKKVGQLDDSVSSKKLGVQMDFEKLFDNPLTGSDSLTSFDDFDHKPELTFDFGEDKQANLQSLANISKIASIPFAKNFLSPLSLTEVDTKPADMSEFTLSFLNNTSEFSPERHVSATLSLQIRKPVASDMYEALTPDTPHHKSYLEEWKESCFESTQTLLPMSQIVSASMTVPKPFLDTNIFNIAPEQEYLEPPGLQMWKIDQFDQGDKPAKPSELARPIRPLKKPISEKGASENLASSTMMGAPVLETLKGNGFEQIDFGVKPAQQSSLLRPIKKPFAEMGQYNPLPSQNIVDRPTLDISEGKLFGFFNTSDSIKSSTVQTSLAINKPFQDKGSLHPLPPSLPENASKFLEWKERCFEVSERRVDEMEIGKLMKHIKNPFVEGAHETHEPEERRFESPFLGQWKHDCFEHFDRQPREAEIVRVLKQIKKPFAEGAYQPLPKHERLFDAPILEGWKDDCFGPIERPVSQIKPSSPLQIAKKPFVDGFYQAIVQQEKIIDTPNLAGWKEDCFSSTEKSAVPLQQLTHSLKPVRKPFAGLSSDPLPSQKTSIGLSLLQGYKEDCFDSNNSPVAPAELAQTLKVVKKPFTYGACLPLPPHERPSEDSLLGKLEENWFYRNQEPVRHAESTQPLQHKKKPFEEIGVSDILLTQESALSESPELQNWKEGFFNAIEKVIAPMDVDQPLKSHKKPFAEGPCQALPIQDRLLDAVDLEGWSKGCFSAVDIQVQGMEPAQLLKHAKQPFEDSGCECIKPQERENDHPTLNGWVERCFEVNEAVSAQSDPVYETKRPKNPFAGGICETLSVQRRHFDEYVLDGWKENCFNMQDDQVLPIEPSYPIKPMKKPFADEGCQPLEFNQANDSCPLSLKTNLFDQVDNQHIISAPLERSQPVAKPIKNAGASLPIIQANEDKLLSKPALRIFGGENQPALPQSLSCQVPVALQVNKPVFANMARHLEADKGDNEIIFIVDSVDASPEISQKAQTAATTSANAKKIRKHLYGNQLSDTKPENFEENAYLEAKYPYFSQTDKALYPHETVGYEEHIPRIAPNKDMRFEHVEERKIDESGTTTVIEHSVSGSVGKSDDFEIVKDSPGREQGEQILHEKSPEETAVKAEEKIVYEDDEEDLAGDSTFLNNSAVNKSAEKNTQIYSGIGQTAGDEKLNEKRKKDALDLGVVDKSDSCKVCSLF